jgi:hypothetical protein
MHAHGSVVSQVLVLKPVSMEFDEDNMEDDRD